MAVAAAPAGERARITNFDSHVIGDTRGPYGAPDVVVDTDGNAVDAHDGRLRYFAGLTIPQAAEVMGISTTTADRYWAYARAWLLRSLDRADADS